MTELNVQQIKDMLLFVADAVISEKQMLTDVDSAIGDGDHGIGMELGMRKGGAKVASLETDDVYAPFKIMGKTMLMSMGGASGVIFGSMFLAGTKGKEAKPSMSAADFAELMADSLTEICARGGAHVGDKTMVDALSPAVDALLSKHNLGFADMLICAEKAAWTGMESTKNFEAKYGRAKTQSSTIGFQDAGATSVWIIFRAMKDFLLSLNQ